MTSVVVVAGTVLSVGVDVGVGVELLGVGLFGVGLLGDAVGVGLLEDGGPVVAVPLWEGVGGAAVLYAASIRLAHTTRIRGPW